MNIEVWIQRVPQSQYPMRKKRRKSLQELSIRGKEEKTRDLKEKRERTPAEKARARTRGELATPRRVSRRSGNGGNSNTSDFI